MKLVIGSHPTLAESIGGARGVVGVGVTFCTKRKASMKRSLVFRNLEEMMDNRIFKPGDRVIVYDYRLFKDDVKTPVSFCKRSGTVVCWYGRPVVHYPINDLTLGPYPSLIDVQFDHDKPGIISHGHFTTFVERI